MTALEMIAKAYGDNVDEREEQKRAKKVAHEEQPKKNPAILDMPNTDNLCLFKAFRVAMYYHKRGGGKWRSAEIHTGTRGLLWEAVDLRRLSGVEEKAMAYSAKDVEKVHQYLERTQPGTYRILVFTDTSGTRPVYNSGNNARYNIYLYLHNGRYDVMKSPQKFFGARHYCAACEKAYANIADHKECSIRCPQCFHSGAGFPCKGEPGKELECLECHKLFPNQDCMDNHKPYSCNTYHRCVYCGAHYRTRPKLSNKGHDCSDRVCRVHRASYRKGASCIYCSDQQGLFKSRRRQKPTDVIQTL